MIVVDDAECDAPDVFKVALALSTKQKKFAGNIYLTNPPKAKKSIPKSFIAAKDCAIVAAPRIHECGLIVGQSGVGKSTWMATYAYTYHQLFPKNSIYIFTPKPQDPAFEEVRGFRRVDIMDWKGFVKGVQGKGPILDTCEDGITLYPDVKKFPEVLHDCLVIFDDIDMIPDRFAAQGMKELRARLMFSSRHDNIVVLSSNHQFRDYSGRLNSPVITEANFVVIFPGNGNEPAIRSLLQEHFQVSVSVSISVTEQKNRSVYIRRASNASIPYKYAITPSYIQLLLT